MQGHRLNHIRLDLMTILTFKSLLVYKLINIRLINLNYACTCKFKNKSFEKKCLHYKLDMYIQCTYMQVGQKTDKIETKNNIIGSLLKARY